MSPLGKVMTPALLYGLCGAFFSFPAVAALHLASDPSTQMCLPSVWWLCHCGRIEKTFLFTCSGSPILKWNKFLNMIAFEGGSFWKEFAPALTAFLNHHCLPLQCICPLLKPSWWRWWTIMAKCSVSFQQALHIVLLLMMPLIYPNHWQYDITLIQWAQQETF